MPLKYFLTLYARLIGLVLLISVLCVALFQGLNSVRLQSWQERFPAPLMQWLASVPAPELNYHWLPALYDFQRLDPDDSGLSGVVRERLGYGQVISLQDSLGTRLMVLDDNDRVLTLRFRDLYREVAEATGLMVLWHLNAVEANERRPAMARLGLSLGVQLQVMDAESLPSATVLTRASERQLTWYRESGRGRVLLRLDDGTLLRLTTPGAFDPWAWPVILVLLVAASAVLALVLRVLLRDVDRSLRDVESVAVRIGRGELEARAQPGENTLVRRLAGAFNGMADHIQRLVGVQREMIHAVSHELRTPVARIRFGVQMIEEDSDPAALKKQLDGIDDDIQELDELIDEILTYARLEQGGPVFSLQETSITGIIRQVVTEQQMVHPKVTLESVIPELSETWSLSDVEPRYLHRAIQNLAGNAARYADSQVRVTAQLAEDNCRVDVEDDGPGIPEEDWEKVFTAFARLDDSRTRTSGGYGLGLSIVRRILYWHGGQAFVSRSEALGGARFSLVWPRRRPEELS